MSTIVLRNVKGSPLTFPEMDANFTNLNNDKWDKTEDQYTVTETPGVVCTLSNSDVYPGKYEVTAPDGGHAAGPHHFQAQFDFITTNWMARGGHMGIVTHADSLAIATNVRGNGLLLGTCNNGYVLSSDLSSPDGANCMLETWMGGLGASQANIVYEGTDGPRGVFYDGVNYRVIVDSCVDFEDRKWLRYRTYRKNTGGYVTDTIEGSTGYWTMIHDTGYHYDSNVWADFTKTGVWFYEVFAPSGTWSIVYSNLVIRWGPYAGQAEEATAVKQPRYYDARPSGLFPRAEDGSGTYNIPDTLMMTGFDNTNITNAANASLWDWDDWVDTNDIKNKLIAAGMSSTTATQIETVFMPLVRVLALHLKHAKKVGW